MGCTSLAQDPSRKKLHPFWNFRIYFYCQNKSSKALATSHHEAVFACLDQNLSFLKRFICALRRRDKVATLVRQMQFRNDSIAIYYICTIN